MNRKTIELNGHPLKPGDEVLLRVKLIKESGAGGIGYNLELPLSRGGAVIMLDKITLINIQPSQIVVNE